MDVYTPVYPTAQDVEVASDQLVEATLVNNTNWERKNGGNFCDVYRVVHPTSQDIEVISDQMVEPTLANNTMYERLGC